MNEFISIWNRYALNTSMADSTISGASAQEDFQFPKTLMSPVFNLPVYLIHCGWSLLLVDDHLKKYGDVGFLRVVYDNVGNATNRTLAIIPENVYDALCEEGYGESAKGSRSYGKGFKIAPFVLRDNDFPREGNNRTLFMPVPKHFNDSQVVPAVNDKLEHLSEWGIVQEKSWSINVPLKSREKGTIQSGCFVSFKPDVTVDQVAMIRILLTDTFWPDQDDDKPREVFKCFWARSRKERPSKDDSMKSKDGRNTKDNKKVVESEESKTVRERKKKENIQNTVKKATPVQKKAPTVPLASQPTLA